jgi:hypothetical protein
MRRSTCSSQLRVPVARRDFEVRASGMRPPKGRPHEAATPAKVGRVECRVWLCRGCNHVRRSAYWAARSAVSSVRPTAKPQPRQTLTEKQRPNELRARTRLLIDAFNAINAEWLFEMTRDRESLLVGGIAFNDADCSRLSRQWPQRKWKDDRFASTTPDANLAAHRGANRADPLTRAADWVGTGAALHWIVTDCGL